MRRARARQYADRGDLRFASELGRHAVFADPGHKRARDFLADVLTRIGYGAENAVWRNCCLTGALNCARASNPHRLPTKIPRRRPRLTSHSP